MFDGWSDEAFAAWLAGYFDGEGCIYRPKSGVGVELSIASTFEPVISAIHARLGVGIVTEVRFTSHANWAPKFHWRVRNYPQADRLLRIMRPHLTIKAAAADDAIAFIAPKMAERERIVARNLEVRAAVAAKEPRASIAARHGLTKVMIWQICRMPDRDPWAPRRETDGRFLRRSTQRHAKPRLECVKTTAQIVAG